ncbi:hypothetical protein [Hymenobacter rubripertinctus]|uniref:Uncharacterized protein n=1 Tax=Hymenobacter rubripertinctus TaxID=2029981 RepID=A0A418R626_9BACT|nr:hypothetical protein [Hymenobacter rubripertinctus]RIY12832.1 hypothetical protein D0T11_03670 [Hymenobacter rubripertinctus]
MNNTFYSLLAKALATEHKQTTASETPPPDALLTQTPAAEPIILLNEFPVVLTPSDYANPRSTANPTGDLRSLWRFRQLADPLPQFAGFYAASGSSTEATYVQVVQGASVKEGNAFAAEIISNAQQSVQSQTFANMDGTPGSWRPVYAVPDNWFDCLTTHGLSALTVDLSGLNAEKSDSPLVWKITHPDQSANTASLDASSKLGSATVNQLMVTLTRPWLDPVLFKTSGWCLQGQNAGFCSSGSNDGQGILSLIPSGIIIGTTASISASWSEKDEQLIANATTNEQHLSLGPLPIVGSQAAASLYVLGWIMYQVPFSPQISC